MKPDLDEAEYPEETYPDVWQPLDETNDQENTEAEGEVGEVVPLVDGKAMCLRCNKTFKTLSIAKAHFHNVHLLPQNAKCQICGKMFKNKNFRREHSMRVHKVSPSMLMKAVKIIPKVEADE